ncbi:unnamed protein product [Urochloa decumbens]|uniref:Uncharacterized protein n=1 Tax=Urochloa decumbens TaxID=240449 RepID=A0ABC8VZ16_9POAL
MASLSVNRSRMQFPNISSSTSYQWRPSLPDSGCKASNAGTAFGHVPSEDIRCKFQNLECSVHKMGMVLDSVQTDVMRLNKGMKDATLESNSTQKKAVVLERSLQEICKGQDDLKELVENCTKINPDQLNVMNSHSSNLDEISLTLSAWPKQMQADLRLLQSDISSVLAEEMQGIVRAIKSFESRPAAIERPSCTIDKRPLMNPVPEVIEKPLVNQTEMKGTSMVSTILIANKRSPLNQTLVVNERSVVNQKPLANGRSLMIQKPAKGRPQKQNPVASGQLTYSQRTYRNPQKSRMPPTKLLPTHLVCPPIEANSNLDIEQGKEPVCMTIDSDENSQGCVSSMIMNTETADAESHMRKEAAEESLRILKRPMKRRGDKKAIIPVKAVSKTARASDETGSGLCKRNSGRDRRPSIRFHGPDWYR